MQDRLYTPEEYLKLERAAEYKDEYRDGRIVPATPATLNHGVIATNLTAEVYWQLRGTPMRCLASTMRMRTDPGHYCYADLTVVGDRPMVAPEDDETLINPLVVFEVYCPLTEAYDRGLKFRRYARLGSLQEYVLVSQDSPCIERFLRLPNGEWAYAEAYGLDAALELQSIGCTLRLASVYDKVELPPEREAEAPPAAE